MIKGKISSETKMWRKVISLVLILWGLNVVVFAFFSHKDYGNFGDSFGAVNSLFSGLALASIVISIFLQRRDLKLQRQDLVMQREELQLQRKELEETRKVFETQSKIMTDQQNDNTFFNLLSNHRQLVNSFTKGERKIGNGKTLSERYSNTYLETVSGYEVLNQIAQRWKSYCASYTFCYKNKVILDLDLHEYESFEKIVNSDPITHVFCRELLHLYKFIDTKFAIDAIAFYRDTLYRSLTQDERFIFEAIYLNNPNERENVVIEPDYYKRHHYVDFSECKLPCVRIFESGKQPDYSRFGIEHNSRLEQVRLIIYERDDDDNYSLTDLVNVPIDELGRSVGMYVSLKDCLFASNLGLLGYPFTKNGEKLKEKRYAFFLKFNHYGEYFEFAFGTNSSVHQNKINDQYVHELMNFKIREISKPEYENLKDLMMSK